MSAKQTPVVLGGAPRAHLLPPEILKERASRRTTRRLGAVTVVVAVVMLGLTGGAVFLNLQSQFQLAAAQAKTSDLVAAQAEYTDVAQLRNQLALVEAGQQVGVSTEIDWKAYLEQVQGTLPAGVAITGVRVESATPMTVLSAASGPLKGAKVATVTFTAESGQLPATSDWLNGLSSLPGYADAKLDEASFNDETQVYTATITLNVDQEAYSGRFQPESEDAE
ncbi:hypothetical protein ACDF64_01405 [Agromyces sp. MMS24-JH15]|uniref:hypothetical protein n=1 Tax=Agromyces sp. MMS24-JH15 TaxID=3243765 RepID=UPI003747BDC3